MKYLVYIFFLSLSLGQLTRISFLDQRINIYLHDAVIFAMIILYVSKSIFKKKAYSQRKLTSIEEASVLFLLSLFLSFINGFWEFTFFQNIVGFLYFGRVCIYFIFLALLTRWGCQNTVQNKKVLRRGIVLFLFLTILFSYLQYFLYPNLGNLSYLGWDPHYYRAFGFFFDTSITGILYIMLFCWLILQKYSHKKTIAIGIISLIILILLTYSRIAYIAFIASMVLFFIKKISPLKMLFFVCGFVILLLIFPRPSGYGGQLTRTYTINTRIVDHKEGLRLWLKKPILGYGYNRLRSITKRPHIFNHAGASFASSYLTILVSSGLIGFAGFIYLLYSLFRFAPYEGKTMVFIVSFSSLFDNIFLNIFVLSLFFSLYSFAILPLYKKQ